MGPAFRHTTVLAPEIGRCAICVPGASEAR